MERSFDLVMYEIFPAAKSKSCLLPLQASGIRLIEFPLPLPLPLKKNRSVAQHSDSVQYQDGLSSVCRT